VLPVDRELRWSLSHERGSRSAREGQIVDAARSVRQTLRAMRTLHVIKHIAREGPGRIADIAKDVGLGVVVHDLPSGAPVPKTLPDGDLLVVMGGPMGVADVGGAEFPFLRHEVDLVARCLANDTPVLGICLGAQLMAHALGARVYPAREREVGWGPVAFATGANEPALAGVGASEIVLHWHGDTFDLPEGATLLASTDVCPNQMFRAGTRAFGLQFHVEVVADEIATWVREDADFISGALGAAGPGRILADTLRFEPRHRQIGDRLIRNILDAMVTGPPS
jgi:GMP synthase (glutamine-hydrolysing)